MKPSERTSRRIVLVGGGHTHVAVLKSFAMSREPGVALTLVAKELEAPYSGMLPGYIAGHYSYDECHIDLVRLAHFASARVIHGEAVGIDRQAKRILIAGRPALAYDLLSLDTGITPRNDDIAGASEHAIAVKPVSSFAPRWQALERLALGPGGPRRIAVIGTGAAGFELILAIRHRLRSAAVGLGLDPDAFRFTLIGSGTLLPTHNAQARRLGLAALAAAGVELIEGNAVVGVGPDAVQLAGGRSIASDAVLITTKAAPPAWFRGTGLALDPDGFIAVRSTLQVVGEDDIFAVGDCATVIAHRREKAGVFAVRQGPPLARNLRLRARARDPVPFKPQSKFLTLLALGDKSAIASRGRLAVAGGWAWKWKDHIDRAFMSRFQKLPAMSGAGGATSTDTDLYCAGCAAKVGPTALSGALDRLGPPAASHAIKDTSPGDDAAVVDLGGDRLRLETVDFFRAPWPEPYVLGEIVAAHALSDVVAKGGTPDHALAIVQVPHATPHLQEDDLFQLMAGARAVFDDAGIAIVGGHSGQDSELAAGFFVSGTVAREAALARRTLQAGDALILTKPLGTGILFAAWMRREARANDVAAALAGMRRSNAEAARIVYEHGAAAATDVTGFGLAGHLAGMLQPTTLAAELDVQSCPLYPGVAALARAGRASSLLAENLAQLPHIAGPDRPGPATLAILFDPQTSGGLLAAVPGARSVACLAALQAAGLSARIVGTIVPRHAGATATIRLTTTYD